MAEVDGELEVRVVPVGPSARTAEAVARAALEHPAVRQELAGADHRLLAAAPVHPEAADGPAAEPSHVRATVFDYTNGRALAIDAPLGESEDVIVAATGHQPLPSGEERAAAFRTVEDDPELGPALRAGRLVPYRPMPPLVFDRRPDGGVERTLTVGLRATDGTAHEIVGVKLARRAVARFEGGAPAASLAAERACGPPSAEQPTAQGVAGQAKVTVSRGGTELWTFIAVRPAASTGTNGSGIELRSVDYRGKRVLRRAHVPILNVRYRRDRCGPFRDWQNEEGMLEADGQDVAPGFRLCPSPAKTILDSGEDEGNFLGVAIYVEGDEVVLVSEMEAGWYRYVSEWRLDANGTIRPRFGFGAVENSCVCTLHHHHVYWRFDFDIVRGADNAVREFNDPPLAGGTRWRTLRREVRRRRSAARKRKWRVVSTRGDERYTLIPGPNDGKADRFGVGDLWALRRHRRERDDGQGFTTNPAKARAGIDRFVNGESIYRTDVVLWYAAHFSHDVGGGGHDAGAEGGHDAGADVGHVVGPDLVPGGWE
jgi:hypothetical protein